MHESSQKMKAMVFDDEPAIRALLCDVLRRRGYEVTAFPGPDARDCLRKGDGMCPQRDAQPCADVILTDLEMPTRNGLHYVEEQLKHGCACPHIALITGSGTDADFERARQLGIKTIKKPLRVKDLEDWLEGVEKKLRRPSSAGA